MVTNISLLSITRRTDLDDYASRVFPRAAGVSLGLTTRTAPADYSLDALNDSLISTTKEALHGRRERAVQFDVKMPSTITSLNVQQTFAADALFDKALEWLQQHDTPAKFYSIEVTGVTDVDSIRPGNTIHVNITAALDGTDVETIDDDFNIVSMNKRLEAGKILIYTLELSTIERQALTESAVMAQAYIGATRGAAGGGATTNTIINGDVSGILDRVEALEEAPLINHDHSGDAGDGGTISHTVLTNIGASDHHTAFTPTDHTNIGNGSPHHAPVTAGDGITVTGQQVALDLADNNTWTGNQLFQGNNTYRNLIPEATDTYDLGSLTKWWRGLYASTINSTVFAQNVQQIIGGSFLIPKNTGTLPLVGSQSDSIDFGKAMTVGDHILVKSFDEGGVAKTEYIKIGDLISGTNYGVTRDEAGAHATDPAWPSGTPYAVLGQAGNGFIQLDATTTPRLSIFTQGATYNDQTEVVRLGDINGLGGITSTTWGAYFGAANKAFMTADPTNGLKISTNDGGLTLNADGLSLDAPDAYLESAAVRWIDSGTALSGQLYSRHQADIEIGEYALYSLHNLILSCEPLTGLDSILGIRAEAPGGYAAAVRTVVNGIAYTSLSCVGTSTAVWQLGYNDGVWGSTIRMYPETGNIQYQGALQSYKNSTAYTGYIYVPLATPLTSTSWDGDAHSSESATKIDMSAVFGAPANMKAVKLRVLARDSVTVHTNNTIRMNFSNVGTGTWTHALWPIGGDFWAEKEITVPCNADGDIYYDINASGASTFDVHIQVLGYYI